MPLESLRAKRSRLIDSRARWAIFRLDIPSQFTCNDIPFGNGCFVLADLTPARLDVWGKRFEQMALFGQGLTGLSEARFRDPGIWTFVNGVDKDFLEKWGLPATDRDKINNFGSTISLADIEYPKDLIRAATSSSALVFKPANMSSSARLNVAIKLYNPDMFPLEVTSYDLYYPDLAEHIVAARARLAAESQRVAPLDAGDF